MGYARIQGALKHLNHRVARSTIAKTLKENGMKPAPDRPMSWSTFVRSHAHLIAAVDFFTTEVWTARGLVTHYTLVVIDIATRRVYLAGTTPNPVSEFMQQIARNLTDCEDGFLLGKRFLIHDRDTVFSSAFRSILASAGVKALLTSYQAPNMNAYAERFIRSIKSECLGQMIFVGQRSLDRAIKEFVEHYHDERSHQGIGNRLISGAGPQCMGSVQGRQRLGGVLSYYHQEAA